MVNYQGVLNLLMLIGWCMSPTLKRIQQFLAAGPCAHVRDHLL